MKNNNIIHRFLTKAINRKRGLLAAGAIAVMAATTAIASSAASPAGPHTGTSLDNNPYISWSPTYNAWTVDAGKFGASDHFSGNGVPDFEIDFGIEGRRIVADEGYHVYAGNQVSIINVAKWRCAYSPSFCIQNGLGYNGNDGTGAAEWEGMYSTHPKCGRRHQNGWIAVCADCGREIYHLIYGTDDAIRSLRTLPGTGLGQFYICPYEYKANALGQPLSGHFEQGAPIRHLCDAISANRYRVRYEANYPAGAANMAGYVTDTIHSYDNNGYYDGVKGDYAKTLRSNNYSCDGYEFAGWNTKPDGSGKAYSNGQYVLNLTSTDNGEVTLYAQWRQCISTLKIDPNGGKFDGSGLTQSFSGQSGSTFSASTSRVTPPAGVNISFVTNGGSACPTIQNTMRFTSWKSGSLYGTLNSSNVYTYPSRSRVTDTLTAQYAYNAITLPTTTWANHSFGGWFFDPQFTKPAGMPGDQITVTQDTVIYAQWAELVLKSVDNYGVYDGAGAVNLSWTQKDNNGKVYKLWQSTNGTNWQQLYSASDIGTSGSVYKNFGKGISQSYTVISSGIYDLVMNGEPGGNYGSYTGGRGGQVSFRIYLKKGDVLSFDVGAGGGAMSSGGFSSGGGYTKLTLNGSLIAVAGGGGGATPIANGGVGGMSSNLVSSMNGQSGMVGGGGGYQGGAAGTLIYHTHTSTCTHQHVVNAPPCYTLVPHEHDGNDEDGGLCYDWKPRYCGACESYSSHGAGTVCAGCGVNHPHKECMGGYYELNCDKGPEWVLSCSRDYDCGKVAGVTIESAYPAYGGSNYLAPDYRIVTSSTQAGVSGACSLEVKSVFIGFFDDLYLNNVVAYDKARPDKIDKGTMTAEPSGDHVSLTWKEPASNGTKYYHKAQSFLMGSNDVLCESNITENTLTSRITGYYYRIDTNPTGEVSGTDPYTTNRSMSIQVQEYDQWLHIAARDAAGNVGLAIHVKITKKPGDGDIPIRWNLHTNQISINGSDGNVYHSHDKTYYVRADGKTPFALSGNGVLDGKPYDGYGINGYGFVSDSGAKQGGSYLKVTGSADGPVSSVDQWSDAGIVLDTYMRYSASYSSGLSVLSGSSDFTMADGYDGRSILVWPRAYAEYAEELRTKTKWSDVSADKNNGLVLIGDARPPIIHGLDYLNSTDVIDRGEETVVLDIWCEDSGSGVGGFTVTVTNSDTGETVTYDHPGDGHLYIDITNDETIFVGDFTVEVESWDNVGNHSTLDSGALGFELQAYITRILDPHDPLFREGESGILHVKTLGFADRIEVSFPAGLEGYTQVIDYENFREYEKNDEIQFMIPLYYLRDYYNGVDHQDNVPLQVKAFKGDMELTAYPKMSVFTIDSTVLVEFRDRLR